MLLQKIEDFFARNFDKIPSKIAVAVSGGVDSLALCLVLASFCRRNKIEFVALSVDHKMRDNSYEQLLELSQILGQKNISHHILRFGDEQIPSANIEAKLRQHRYDLLYEFCVDNKVEHLFLGHHQGDVAENFLIRLFRGSQIDGLAKMAQISNLKKIKICRPFLELDKEALKKYLLDLKISWFEDQTNKDEKFLRNKIRNFLQNFDESALIEKRIAGFSENLAQDRLILDEILLENAKKILKFDEKGEFFVNLDEYKKVPPRIALKILSLVLQEISGQNYKPRLEKLKRFEGDILNLAKGKKRDFYGCMAQICSKEKMTETGIAKLHLQKSFFGLFEKKTRFKNQNWLRISRDENGKKNPAQKFDENLQIIDGRFLVDKNGATRFCFRTVLGEVFG